MLSTVWRAVRDWGREWIRRRREATAELERLMEEPYHAYRAGRATLEELGSPPEAWLAKPAKKTDSTEVERPAE